MLNIQMNRIIIFYKQTLKSPETRSLVLELLNTNKFLGMLRVWGVSSTTIIFHFTECQKNLKKGFRSWSSANDLQEFLSHISNGKEIVNRQNLSVFLGLDSPKQNTILSICFKMFETCSFKKFFKNILPLQFFYTISTNSPCLFCCGSSYRYSWSICSSGLPCD